MTLLRRVIGVVLRRARLGQGKTLRDVAEAARVSVQYLSEVERGRKEASSEVLAAICAALGWSILDLLDEVRSDLATVPAIPLHVPAEVPGREPVEVPPSPAPVRGFAEVEPAGAPAIILVPARGAGSTPVASSRVPVAA